MTTEDNEQKVGESWSDYEDRAERENFGRLDGMLNPTAAKIPIEDACWSDGNFDRDFDKYPVDSFIRLKCRQCTSFVFEVLDTNKYETTARCFNCGRYYIVDSG